MVIELLIAHGTASYSPLRTTLSDIITFVTVVRVLFLHG